MSDLATTPFSKRCEILADVWLNYRDESDFGDFVEYNDLGLPLAYAVSYSMVTPTPSGEAIINESWDLFLAGLETEDVGFDSLDDLLG